MLGAGGHARVLQESLTLAGRELDSFIALTGESRLIGVEWLGGEEVLGTLDPGSVVLVNGIGSVGSLAARKRLFDLGTAAGFAFATVIDATAVIRPSATIERGAQVLAGAIVNSGATIGADAVINSGAIVEHDCRVGPHSHLSPGAVLAGDVVVGAETHVGLGARVIQGISVGSQCVIGAGAVVIRDIPDGFLAVGVPAEARTRA